MADVVLSDAERAALAPALAGFLRALHDPATLDEFRGDRLPVDGNRRSDMGRRAFLDVYGPVSEAGLLRARVLAVFLCATLAEYGRRERLRLTSREAKRVICSQAGWKPRRS